MPDLESPIIDLEPHEWERQGKAWWETGEKVYEPPIYWDGLAWLLAALAFIAAWVWFRVAYIQPFIDNGGLHKEIIPLPF